MTSEQQHLICTLVEKYSIANSTENLISCAAETEGLLVACKELLKSVKIIEPDRLEWLQAACKRNAVVYQSFLSDISHLLTLFNTEIRNENYHAVLEVDLDATIDEIKRAYRKLSLRYHPDTNISSEYDTEKFIALNQAYVALTAEQQSSPPPPSSPFQGHWKNRKASSPQSFKNKSMAVWISISILVFIAIIGYGSISFKKKAMLAGLQQSGENFQSSAIKATPTISSSLTVQENHGNVEPSEPELNQPAPERDKLERQILLSRREPRAENEELNKHLTAALTLDGILPHSFPTNDENITHNASNEKKNMHANPRAMVSPSPESPDHKKLLKNRLIDQKYTSVSPQKPSKVTEKKTASKNETTEVKNLPTTPTPQQIASSGSQKHISETETASVKNTTSFDPYKSDSSTLVTEEKDATLPIAYAFDFEQQGLATSTTVVEETGPPEKELVIPHTEQQPSINSTIDLFMQKYLAAYNQRNFKLFSSFFATNAIENGRPATSFLPVYMALFVNTSDLILCLSDRKVQEVEDLVLLDGHYRVEITYLDGSKLTGSGPIHFVFTNETEQYRIKSLEYVFNVDNHNNSQ